MGRAWLVRRAAHPGDVVTSLVASLLGDVPAGKRARVALKLEAFGALIRHGHATEGRINEAIAAALAQVTETPAGVQDAGGFVVGRED